MSNLQEMESLRSEIKALRSEVKDLKEFIKAIYSMIDEEGEEYQSIDFPGGAEVGRYNT